MKGDDSNFRFLWVGTKDQEAQGQENQWENEGLWGSGGASQARVPEKRQASQQQGRARVWGGVAPWEGSPNGCRSLSRVRAEMVWVGKESRTEEGVRCHWNYILSLARISETQRLWQRAEREKGNSCVSWMWGSNCQRETFTQRNAPKYQTHMSLWNLICSLSGSKYPAAPPWPRQRALAAGLVLSSCSLFLTYYSCDFVYVCIRVYI